MENLEEFVPIKGYEGIYEINKLGIVMSLHKKVKSKSKFVYRTLRPKIMSNPKDGGGYPTVKITDFYGVRTQHKIHRLVAQSFIPNPENKPQVNHKNGIKTDNRVENLEWCTCSENIKHAFDNGLKIKSQIKVTCVDSGRSWNSISECSRDMGVLVGTLWYRINYRKHKTSIRILK